MNEVQYIIWDELLYVYRKTVEDSGGGFAGLRDEDRIKSVLEFVQSDIYYPTFESKLTFLVSRICTGHLFSDGNKRMSLTLGVYFLLKNGYYWAATTFMTHMAAIIIHVAAGNIDEEMLSRIIPYVIKGENFPEDLQLEMAEAMSKDTLYNEHK